MEIACYFCSSHAVEEEYLENKIIKCPVCGKYILSSDFFNHEVVFYNKYSSYLVYNKSKSIPVFGKNKQYFKVLEDLQTSDTYKFITEDDVENFYPKTFSDKINRILIWLEKNSHQYGIFTVEDSKKLESVFFIQKYANNGFSLDYQTIQKQYTFITHYLSSEKHYVLFSKQGDNPSFMITPDGYEKLEKINENKKEVKKVFVAMAFNENTNNTREAIRKGIQKAEYDATLIDEIIHNKQIVPEMLRLIRESKLLVMDITEPNYGAYYEAGYAQGLGKEVIITCSDKVFSKKYESEEDKKMMKYIKPHFDIAQKQILVWHDEEDLTNKLKEWIKAIE